MRKSLLLASLVASVALLGACSKKEETIVTPPAPAPAMAASEAAPAASAAASAADMSASAAAASATAASEAASAASK